MAELTVINTGMGEIKVHNTGCRDISRAPRGSSIWTVEATCLRDVVVDLYTPEEFPDMNKDGSNWLEFAGDIDVLPCVGDLPYDAPTDTRGVQRPDDQMLWTRRGRLRLLGH